MSGGDPTLTATASAPTEPRALCLVSWKSVGTIEPPSLSRDQIEEEL
ncbi:MAG TPA: hypothetical protein VMU32_03555 [Solirubrobacteraceae bacterium]|nr:hypothetical protein [Solirubrobacteraceae bacterium]